MDIDINIIVALIGAAALIVAAIIAGLFNIVITIIKTIALPRPRN